MTEKARQKHFGNDGISLRPPPRGLSPRSDDWEPVEVDALLTGPPPCIRRPDTGPVACLGHAGHTVTWLRNSSRQSTAPRTSGQATAQPNGCAAATVARIGGRVLVTSHASTGASPVGSTAEETHLVSVHSFV